MKLLLHTADEKEIVYNFLVLFGVFYIQISSQILNFAQRHKSFFYISLVIFQKILSDSLLILITIFKPISSVFVFIDRYISYYISTTAIITRDFQNRFKVEGDGARSP